MIIDSIFQIVDRKIEAAETAGKRVAVIAINESLYKQIQQEMFTQNMSMAYGKVQSPYALQVYKGAKVISSQVVESVEVL